MRADKFLKLTRIVKRRSLANELCGAERVKVNNKIAKASTKIKEGDIIEIRYGNKLTKLIVKEVPVFNEINKEKAKELVEIIETIILEEL